MPQSEKEIFHMLCTYFRLVEGQVTQIRHQLDILENAVTATPALAAALEKSRVETKSPFLPGLGRQLAAIQETIAKLPG